MALNAKNKKRVYANDDDFVEQPLLEEGSYNCRVVQIIELGLQPQRPHKGQAKPPVDMLYVTYEVGDEFMLDENGEEIEDKPRWESEDFPYYGVDCDMAKCNKRLKAIDPSNKVDGDWAKIGGAPVVVTFVHNIKPDKTYVNVASASVMKKKDIAKQPKLQNPIKVFDIDDPDMEIFASLPKWLQAKIKGNLNYKGSVLEKAVNGEEPDEPEKEEPEQEEQAEKPSKPEKKKATKKKVVKKEPEPEPEEAEEEEDDDEPWG